MKTLTTVREMVAFREACVGRVGLVPTMGYLHEGHLSLVRRSRTDCDTTVVSIFVNPTQFGPNEDLDRYPRDIERDLTLLSAEGVDAVFLPTTEEMYPPGFADWVEVTGPVVERLEGQHRPGHFRGVTTVVARLFRIIEPDRAYFGQKDAQQLRVIRRMTRDLGLPVEVVGLPTVRDSEGLAMSSRNVFLSSQDRAAALGLSRGLRAATTLVADRETDAGIVRDAVVAEIATAPSAAPEYISIADEETLEELDVVDRPALVLVAARVGSTRLIDNVVVVPPDVTVPEHLLELTRLS